MGNTVGYMVTWRMYGTWLQGDVRGYVKDGEHFGHDDNLYGANRSSLKGCVVRLPCEHKKVVEDAILEEAQRKSENVVSIAVCSDHVHVVVRHPRRDVGKFVGRSKATGRLALKDYGYAGKVWAKGYHRRFCFDEASLEALVDYVNGHEGEV